MEKKNLLQSGIVVGVCLGVLAGFLFPINLLQYWKRLDYFPYPVTKIVNVWGDKIWIETKTGESYIIEDQCREESCWQKIESASDYFDRSDLGSYYEVQFNETCKFEHATYPLFQKIKMCAGTNQLSMGGGNWIYLALTEKGEIWVWHGGLLTPPVCFIFPPVFGFLGLALGWIIGTVLIFTKKLVSNRKL